MTLNCNALCGPNINKDLRNYQNKLHHSNRGCISMDAIDVRDLRTSREWLKIEKKSWTKINTNYIFEFFEHNHVFDA